jgi:hypothetical protein
MQHGAKQNIDAPTIPTRRTLSMIIVLLAIIAIAALLIALSELGRTISSDRPASWDMDIRLLTALAAIFAVILSIFTFRFSQRRLHEMKTIDLMRSFQDRYDRLVFEDSIDETPEGERHFYLRYWNLQLEQYQYWKQYLIEDGIFEYWMALRREAYNETMHPFRRKLSVPFAKGWEEAKQGLKLGLHRGGDFQRFMDHIFTSRGEIPSIMGLHRPWRPWRQWLG